MEQESPTDTPEQEQHSCGETKWEPDSQASEEGKKPEFSEEFQNVVICVEGLLKYH